MNRLLLVKPEKIIGFAFCLLFLLQGLLLAEKISYVIDGDTVILADNQRVRLIGINAPETDHRRYGKKGQKFGNESKDYLKRMIEKKDVRLESGDEAFDRFGRRLAYLYLQDGTFVNRKMVETGNAEVFRKFPFKFRKEFLELEQAARADKLGMWGERTPSFLDWIAEYWAEFNRKK